MVVSREQLREVRGAALRRRVWYKVLDDLERGIVNLTICVVESVRSPTLMREISRILVKLRGALETAFERHLGYGFSRVAGIVEVAVGFGNEGARGWGTDAFAWLLAVNEYYNPVGWRRAPG